MALRQEARIAVPVTVGAHPTSRGVNGRPIANSASDGVLLLSLNARSVATHADANALLFVAEEVG